ncbi:MAG: FAD-dependent oxidoreductase [Sedimentisphaerales bacterium]|nr:FAD-dependent oxidoreductase [Sedimentisphaerales bacterium]
MAYDVDVVVVGSSSAGVAAAVAASREGASVFLAAPRTYLGEDLCATYRLWLEAGEEAGDELAKRIFSSSGQKDALPKGLPFRYQTDVPSADRHKDTATASLLADGRWFSAAQQSVQYDGDVTITLDLQRKQSIAAVHVLVYQRPEDFAMARVQVWAGDDGRDWNEGQLLVNERQNDGGFEQTALDIAGAVTWEARYLKLQVQKASSAGRVLLGEIIIEAPPSDPEQPRPELVGPLMVTPMQVKRALDEALLEAEVKFLFGCYPTDILLDDQGNLSGIVVADVSGRQAVRAKVIIDATERATAARLAGAAFRPYPPGEQEFRRVVIQDGPEIREHETVRKLPVSYRRDGREFAVLEYTFSIPMADGSFAAFARAEQIARDRTWSLRQADSSEVLFQVPPDPLIARQRMDGPWAGADKIDLDVFRPASFSRMYVLGGCADISRPAAELLLRPATFMAVGTRLGRSAAQEAKTIPPAGILHVAGPPVGPNTQPADVGELLDNLRPQQPAAETIACGPRSLPVADQHYDVIVVGGGTAGAPAAIGAARQGAKTLLVEYLHGLGGVGTLGLISSYYYGNRVGFTAELDQALAEWSGSSTAGRTWNVEHKMEWYRRAARQAGADIWFGCLGIGAVVDSRQVRGVVIATPLGRQVVLAHTVIDATGSAAVAAAAGATCRTIGAEHIAVQGTGLPPRELGAGYTNTDYTFVDETDSIDIWRAFVLGRQKFPGAYDLGQLIDTRERRRIVGDFTISPLDIWNRRTYPDTISIHISNFDTHGFTVHPVFMIRPPDRETLAAHVPFRALLPAGWDGILVTGLGVSAHRDAMPVIRMQACVQNQGYAAGLAAALAAQDNYPTRAIDIKRLQRMLVDKGNLPESVLTDRDAFALTLEKIQQAVLSVVPRYDQIEVLLAEPQKSLPLLRQAYRETNDPNARRVYAHILGMFADDTGLDTLIEIVDGRGWDQGWNYRGMGQFGASLSELDSLIIALGRTANRRALPPILRKTEQLTSRHEFSHHRAVALALESLGDAAAAECLAGLLQKPNMTGYAYLDIESVRQRQPASSTDNTTRTNSLRELVLARALYRCGDFQAMGQGILEQYARDLRGHYARHARAILKER